MLFEILILQYICLPMLTCIEQTIFKVGATLLQTTVCFCEQVDKCVNKSNSVRTTPQLCATVDTTANHNPTFCKQIQQFWNKSINLRKQINIYNKSTNLRARR